MMAVNNMDSSHNHLGGSMNLANALTQLEAQSQAICALVSGLGVEEVRWKPAPESWSVLEVLSHLVDEEICDFRAHLDHILHTPEQPWPEIDPMGWVTARYYNENELDETLTSFKAEREQSLAWLAQLTQLSWDAAVSLSWGSLSAGDMLASWLAHDLLHLRQLVELRYQLTGRASQPYRLEYAGNW
jgi:hypothetical protein